MQIADAAQRWIGVKCFKKEHYPVPEHAFTAVSEQVAVLALPCHVCMLNSQRQ